VCTSVFIYFQRMMNAMRPFASAARFPKSVCNALIDGLDSRLVPIFHRNYPDHAVLHDLSASYQRGKFKDILQAMQMAENEVNSINETACSTVNRQRPGIPRRRFCKRQSGRKNVVVLWKRRLHLRGRHIGRVSFGWWTFYPIKQLTPRSPRSLLRLQRTPPVGC
jgi:hypothetical protein